MFLQTWNKYLPVIKILLKRSVNGEQTLDMNSSDFQRASGGKKVKFTFSIPLIRGRVPTGGNFSGRCQRSHFGAATGQYSTEVRSTERTRICHEQRFSVIYKKQYAGRKTG
jgi:hypothetical protein